MRRVFSRIAQRKESLKSHPFFSRAYEIDGNGVEEKLRIWAPLFVHLAMTFRDINLMYYVYPSPSSDFERAINAHANVDGTHWRMLVADLAAVGVDRNVASYGDAMQAIWSERGAPIRNYMYWVLHRAQRCGTSPFMKMAAMESGEATVKMFFSTTRHVASVFEAKTGVKLGYFGDNHMDSEIDNAVELNIFEDVELDESALREGLWIVDDHFEKFEAFLDYKLEITFGEG
jgi:hypothetical protein